MRTMSRELKLKAEAKAKRKAAPNQRTCKSCGKPYSLPGGSNVAGKTRCPHCGQSQRS